MLNYDFDEIVKFLNTKKACQHGILESRPCDLCARYLGDSADLYQIRSFERTKVRDLFG